MIKGELIKRLISSIFLLPILIFFIVKGTYFFIILLIICFLISVFEWNQMAKKNDYKFVGVIFLIFSFYTTYKLRNNLNGDYIYLLFVSMICIATDLGGFIFGKLLKGPKLTNLSPNKTYSGMIGSYVLSLAFIYLFPKNFFFLNSYTVTAEIIVFSLLVSSISQIGDITVSYFKRLSKIKDTGKIIPGHGGLLDRIDGMIFAFPLSYFLITVNYIDLF